MEVQVISNTVQKFNGESFYLCGYYYQRKGKRLHRAVWEHHNGPIPKGYHVHHMDGDRSNNSIENLTLLEGHEHLSEHMSAPERVEHSKKLIEFARVAASKWHGSDAGRAWHAEHGKEYWKNAPMLTYTCTNCGKEYQTRNVSHSGNHFCGNNCRAAYRRKTGADNVERTCQVCGKPFVVNKYSRVKTCSGECGVKLRRGK